MINKENILRMGDFLTISSEFKGIFMKKLYHSKYTWLDG